jgi:hypothetical protein
MVKDIIEIDENIFASIALDNKLIIYNYIKKRNFSLQNSETALYIIM